MNNQGQNCTGATIKLSRNMDIKGHSDSRFNKGLSAGKLSCILANSFVSGKQEAGSYQRPLDMPLTPFVVELYLYLRQVPPLCPGIYCYRSEEHAIQKKGHGHYDPILFSGLEGIRKDNIDLMGFWICNHVFQSRGQYQKVLTRAYMEIGSACRNLFYHAKGLGLTMCELSDFRKRTIETVVGKKRESIDNLGLFLIGSDIIVNGEVLGGSAYHEVPIK